MRFAVTAVLWLASTVALAVAVPAAWAQLHVVDADGYAALAENAAHDPALQSAMAAELTTRAMALIAAHGGGSSPIDGARVHDAASAFTAGPAFPPLFAQANRAAHDWVFYGSSGRRGDRWVVDLAPMLKDDSLRPVLNSYHVRVPANLTVPITVSVPQPLRPGQLSPLSRWGPWVSIGAVALSGVCAALTLLAARRRGKALTSLGVSALLVGAGGWAAIEIAGRYINHALNRTTGDIRRVAEVMVGHAEAGVHHWLNLTLVTGAGLVALGVVVAVLGSLGRKA